MTAELCSVYSGLNGSKLQESKSYRYSTTQIVGVDNEPEARAVRSSHRHMPGRVSGANLCQSPICAFSTFPAHVFAPLIPGRPAVSSTSESSLSFRTVRSKLCSYRNRLMNRRRFTLRSIDAGTLQENATNAGAISYKKRRSAIPGRPTLLLTNDRSP